MCNPWFLRLTVPIRCVEAASLRKEKQLKHSTSQHQQYKQFSWCLKLKMVVRVGLVQTTTCCNSQDQCFRFRENSNFNQFRLPEIPCKFRAASSLAHRRSKPPNHCFHVSVHVFVLHMLKFWVYIAFPLLKVWWRQCLERRVRLCGRRWGLYRNNDLLHDLW